MQEPAVSNQGAGTEASTPQATPAVAPAGNLPDYSVPDYSAEVAKAQEQNAAIVTTS